MKKQELAEKIKNLRLVNAFSQEKLAEESGLSLRTIQRIENAETLARGDSLQMIAKAFDIPVNELVDGTIQEDDKLLLVLNLSALSFLVFPLFGILIPLIIWIPKKDKVQKLNQTAKELLNFQITWTLMFFLQSIFLVFIIVAKMSNTYSSNSIKISLSVALVLKAFLYLYNIVFILLNSLRINKSEAVRYRPKIRFIK